MKFRIKTEGLTGDQLKAAEDLNKILEGMPESMTKEELDAAIAEATKGLAKTEELTKQIGELKAILAEQGTVLETMKANPGEKPISLIEELKAKKEEIRALMKGGATKEVVLKALVLRSAVANNEWNIDLPDIGQLATRKLSLYDIFPKFPVGAGTHNGTIRYYDWDEDTIVRAAAAVAEGAPFPESTAKWKKGTITLQKIGDTLPVTEEFLEDEVQFAAELSFFLNTNVQLEMDRQLAVATGSGNTLTGLLASINEWTVVSAGVEAPTIYDILVKMREGITKTMGGKYNPDVAIMNITVINRMKLAKDANENYILPPFVSRDGKMVDAMTVIEANIFDSDTIVVGDRRFARIYEMGGVEITRGLVNAQFTEDEMTLKARKRMAFLIRAADKGGWLKCTDIATALTELAETASV